MTEVRGAGRRPSVLAWMLCSRPWPTALVHARLLGRTAQVTPDQRLALVEYLAHLTTADWDGCARDLQKLGFIPEEVCA